MIDNLIRKLFLPFSTIFLASLGIGIYTKSVNNVDLSLDGFVGSTVTKSNKYVCKARKYKCVKNIIKDLNNSNKNILLFGNSQLGAINKFSEGEINYAQQLALNYKDSFVVRSIWLPNANLSEFKLIYSSLRECSVRIDNLIIPVSGHVTYLKSNKNTYNLNLNFSYGNFLSQSYLGLHQIGSGRKRTFSKNYHSDTR